MMLTKANKESKNNEVKRILMSRLLRKLRIWLRVIDGKENME